MKNFLGHLGDKKPWQRKEVVVVSHASFLELFVDHGRKLSNIIRINEILNFVSVHRLGRGRV
jgi:hypothetical protein